MDKLGKSQTLTHLSIGTWITDYGAVGDGITNNADSINRAIEVNAQRGGGTVVVPSGVYLTGPIQLLSHVNLYLDAGAVIKGSPRLEDYSLEQDKFSMESNRAGLITARDAESITISGRGIIDGNGLSFQDAARMHMGSDFEKRFTRQGADFMHPRFGTQHSSLAHGDRPGNLVRFANCRNVLISGVTIQNSPTWTTHIRGCDQVDILGVKINSLGSDCRVTNDDGIDLVRSKRVHIADCDIQTGDDCIALFGSEMVTMSNCTLSSRSAGIRIGFFNDGDTRDCVFNNLVIHSNRGITVCVRGESSVENILFSNITLRTQLFTGYWWGQAEPIQMSVMPWDPNAKHLGQIRKISFRNILAESENGILIYGCEQASIQNVFLEDIHVRIKKGPLQESYGGNFDLRSTDDPATALFKHDIPGLYACYFDGLTISNFTLSWDEELPDFYTHAIQCEHFTDLCIRDFRGVPAHTNVDTAIALSDGHGIAITGSEPATVSVTRV